jgi:hypothetical protein
MTELGLQARASSTLAVLDCCLDTRGEQIGRLELKNMELIPTRIDHDPCAHCRMPMDMMRHSWLTRLFQAKQQWSTISS